MFFFILEREGFFSKTTTCQLSTHWFRNRVDQWLGDKLFLWCNGKQTTVYNNVRPPPTCLPGRRSGDQQFQYQADSWLDNNLAFWDIGFCVMDRHLKMTNGPMAMNSCILALTKEVSWWEDVGFPVTDQCMKMTDDPTLMNIQIPIPAEEEQDLSVNQHCFSYDRSLSENEQWSLVDLQSDTDANGWDSSVGQSWFSFDISNSENDRWSHIDK